MYFSIPVHYVYVLFRSQHDNLNLRHGKILVEVISSFLGLRQFWLNFGKILINSYSGTDLIIYIFNYPIFNHISQYKISGAKSVVILVFMEKKL